MSRANSSDLDYSFLDSPVHSSFLLPVTPPPVTPGSRMHDHDSHALTWDGGSPEILIELQTQLSCDVIDNESVTSTFEVADELFILHENDEGGNEAQQPKSAVETAAPAVETTVETKEPAATSTTTLNAFTVIPAIVVNIPSSTGGLDVDAIIDRVDTESMVHKLDGRGKHWAKKVKAGYAPTASAATKEWAKREKETEKKFEGFMRARNLDPTLPWRSPGAARSSGNTKKVLYMELLMLHAVHAARVELSEQTADGLYDIVGFTVPPAGRAAFDAGSVPSLASAASGTARKSLAKIWQTSGFRERQLPDGTLLFEHDPAVSARQRAQQSAKRRRADA